MDALTILDAAMYGALAALVGLRGHRTGQVALRRLSLFLATIGVVAASLPVLEFDGSWIAIVTLLGGIALYPVFLLRFGAVLTAEGRWVDRLVLGVLTTELVVMAAAPLLTDFQTAVMVDLLVAATAALIAHGAVLVVLYRQVRAMPSSFVRRRALALTAGLVLLAASLAGGVFAGLFADLPPEVALAGGAVAALLLVAATAPPRWLQAAFILPDWDRLLAAEEEVTSGDDPVRGMEHALRELALLLCGDRAWLTRDGDLVAMIGAPPTQDELASSTPDVSRAATGPDGEPQWLLASSYLSHRLVVVADRDPVLYGLDAAQLLPRTVRRLAVAFEGRQAEARRRAQELAEQEAQHYRHIVELKDDLLATINHELRTPLGLVTGALELVRARWDDLSDAHRRLLTERADANAQDLAGVVTQVLALVGLRSGETVPRSRRTSPAAIAAVALEGLPVAGRVRLTASDDDVIVDEELAARILRELTDNALRHTADRVEVIVGVEADELLLEVVDHGPGLHDELAETFARGGNHLHRTTRGLGLGLTLVVETAARLGGEVVFGGEADETCVSCRVPHGAAVAARAATIAGRD